MRPCGGRVAPLVVDVLCGGREVPLTRRDGAARHITVHVEDQTAQVRCLTTPADPDATYTVQVRRPLTGERFIEGATIADVASEAIERIDEPNAASPAPLLITAAGSHDLFLNAAAAWADVAAVAPLLFTGVITVKWRKIS